MGGHSFDDQINCDEVNTNDCEKPYEIPENFVKVDRATVTLFMSNEINPFCKNLKSDSTCVTPIQI